MLQVFFLKVASAIQYVYFAFDVILNDNVILI